MKHSELRMGTIYADHDGRPLMLLSLDKFAKPSGSYGSRRIRRMEVHDKSFGVLIVRLSYRFHEIGLDKLRRIEQELRNDVPDREQHRDTYEVRIESLRLIAETWEEHLESQRAEAERKQAAADKAEALRQSRADIIEKIENALPEGVQAQMADYRGWAQIPLTHLLTLATAAVPVEVADGVAFTPREMSLLAAGFDAAIATMQYEDGSPVDLVSIKNPYRIDHPTERM